MTTMTHSLSQVPLRRRRRRRTTIEAAIVILQEHISALVECGEGVDELVRGIASDAEGPDKDGGAV